MKEQPIQKMVASTGWKRIILLIILGYEAAGCLLGGILLISAPDGSYMNMPVDLMHGFFRDFLIPGIILFGLGILNTIGFISVLRKTGLDWFFSSLALGSMFIWFVVEIIILRELHWLHAMWGLPVLLGWVMIIPLIAQRNESLRLGKSLLVCGILSSLWYFAINIFVPITYNGYHLASQTVSELSAIGAPSRILWVLLSILYPLLFGAFGWGVLQAKTGSRALRIAGNLIILYSIVNFYWPPMHQREVLASGAGSMTDVFHIIWAMITLILMMIIMGFGAAALGKRFRLFTIATFIIFILFGIMIGTEAPGIQRNLPTPYIGIWERINIGAFMLWVIVFAIVLIRRKNNLIQRSFDLGNVNP